MKTEQELKQLLENAIYCFNNYNKNPTKQYITLLEWILDIFPNDNLDKLLAYKIKRVNKNE